MVVIGVADHDGCFRQAVGNRATDREGGGITERASFEAMLPPNAAIGRSNPGLVDDKKPATDKQQRPKSSKRNIVLEKNVAPPELADQLERPGLPNDRKRKSSLAGGLGYDMDVVTHLDKFTGEQVRYGLDSARTRKKMMRAQEYFHERPAAFMRATTIRRTREMMDANAFY